MAIILCYGVPGAGKSLLLHDLIKAQSHERRFFVVEHSDEWGPDSLHWRGNPPANLVMLGPGDKFPGDPGEFEETGVYVWQGMDGLDVATIAVNVGNVVFVDDELDLIARTQGWRESPLRKMVHTGRHLPNVKGEICEAHIMGACRRPQNLVTDLTDLADQVYVFRVQGKNTRKRLEADSMIEENEWETIRTQENFHFKHWPSGEFLTIDPIGEKEAKEDE